LSVTEAEGVDERRLRSLAAAAAIIAAGWLVFAVIRGVRPAPGDGGRFVIIGLIAIRCMLLGRRAVRQSPSRQEWDDWWWPCFTSLVCFFELTRATGAPVVVEASAPVFSVLTFAAFLLERRRIHAAPGRNLARGIYESGLSPATCEQRLAERLATDGGSSAASPEEKQILLRFTRYGARLRVQNPWWSSWFFYYLRFHPTPTGSKIEVCPVIRPWAVTLVAIWLSSGVAALGAGLSIMGAHRTLGKVMLFGPLAVIPPWTVVHFTVFGREPADRARVLALLADDLEARALHPLQPAER